jgi:hypothetical protein
VNISRRPHPTFWRWLEQHQADATPAGVPPFELVTLLTNSTAPLAASREAAVRRFLDAMGLDEVPVVFDDPQPA